MSDLKTLAIRVAVFKALIDRVTEADQAARAQLVDLMQQTGAERATAVLPDGTKVSSVSLAGGDKTRARVVDDEAFLSWVRTNRPAEIEEKVRDAFKKALLKEIETTGEVIPGVEFGASTVYVTNRFTTGGKETIAQAWGSGALSLSEVLALPAGGDHE